MESHVGFDCNAINYFIPCHGLEMPPSSLFSRRYDPEGMMKTEASPFNCVLPNLNLPVLARYILENTLSRISLISTNIALESGDLLHVT